jgi:hypothetical protein
MVSKGKKRIKLFPVMNIRTGINELLTLEKLNAECGKNNYDINPNLVNYENQLAHNGLQAKSKVPGFKDESAA